MKEYIYRYDNNQLIRLRCSAWNRVLQHDLPLPEFAGHTFRVIYAYVEMHNRQPIYCHRIDAVNCQFDSAGYYISPPIPDPGLLDSCVRDQVADFTGYRSRSEYRKQRYWDIPPVLLDRVLETIWREP